MKPWIAIFAVLALAVSPTATAQQAAQVAILPEIPPTDPLAPFDNVKASWVNFETHPIQMGYVAAGGEVVAVNQPGLRLGFFDLPDGGPVEQIPVGPGVTAVVPRPGTSEIWAVDSVTHSISVVDRSQRTIVRTIQLQGSEPHGLAFHPEGNRAYVACSGSNTVEILDPSDGDRFVKSIAVPGLHPRAIAFLGDPAWVVPFTSGNNTTSMPPPGNPNGGVADRVSRITDPNLNAFPDRDLLAIVAGATPDDDALDPNRTVTGLGSNLFNLHVRPGTQELWVPNTEARNWEFVGEKNFPAGQVVFNRVPRGLQRRFPEPARPPRR